MKINSRPRTTSIEQSDRAWFNHTGDVVPPASDQVDPHDEQGRTYWEISSLANAELDDEGEAMQRSGSAYSGDNSGNASKQDQHAGGQGQKKPPEKMSYRDYTATAGSERP